MAAIPKLTGDAGRAVRHRGSHAQIIASAGSGKTEVVAQRVAELFASGVEPDQVVAFTFTDRAADALKSRIEKRVSARLGPAWLDRMNRCFVGTIHAYCYRLLQEHLPIYETFDVLDDNQLAAFLSREANTIGLRQLAPKHFEAISRFIGSLDVVDNELLPLDALEDPFRECVERFWSSLYQYRFLTYGQLVAKAVEALRIPTVAARVHERLRHLIVDEYQDVNPAQEQLIRLLAEPAVELTVVGDDDQAIYQWRGADVGNIVGFGSRYDHVTTFRITKNRRSRPGIIEAANEFALTIDGRLPKTMRPDRIEAAPEIVCWMANTETEEADLIARTMRRLHDEGWQYRDMAVLVRSSASYPKLLAALEHEGVPVAPAGRTGLFATADGQLFGETCAFLAGSDWRVGQWGGTVLHPSLDSVVEGYVRLYNLTAARRGAVRDHLAAWKAEVTAATRPADLIAEYYELLARCSAALWDLTEPHAVTRLGNLARCSALLADHESVRRRARPDVTAPGEAVGGQDRGEWYYKWLAIHVQNWAAGSFEAFEGEPDVTLDAVDLITIHKAKGLEWPIVFVPCVSANRFPPTRMGQRRPWLVSEHLFDSRRYEGSDADERRLFYVAITRARDWLSVSSHDTPNVKKVAPSPYLVHVAGGARPPRRETLPLPPARRGEDAPEELPLTVTFSDLAAYADCGMAFRLRELLGFPPRLAPEIGYGKAVHHILREIAERTRDTGRVPAGRQLDRLFDDHFHLPAANKVAYRNLKSRARALVDRYVTDWNEDLRRVWATERPFELHLPGGTVGGRADVILDYEGGEIAALAIVDYKTASVGERAHDLQLQVYTDAGRREGLTVRAAYVHDLKRASRDAVDVSPNAVIAAEAVVRALLDGLRARRFEPAPERRRCAACDVRPLCRYAAS